MVYSVNTRYDFPQRNSITSEAICSLSTMKPGIVHFTQALHQFIRKLKVRMHIIIVRMLRPSAPHSGSHIAMIHSKAFQLEHHGIP
jgi:hypothetical protein